MTTPPPVAVSLLDEATKLARRGGTICSVFTLRQTNPGLADELGAAFGKVTTTALHRALKNRGIEISDQTINRHFRHECSCEPR